MRKLIALLGASGILLAACGGNSAVAVDEVSATTSSPPETTSTSAPAPTTTTSRAPTTTTSLATSTTSRETTTTSAGRSTSTTVLQDQPPVIEGLEILTTGYILEIRPSLTDGEGGLHGVAAFVDGVPLFLDPGSDPGSPHFKFAPSPDQDGYAPEIDVEIVVSDGAGNESTRTFHVSLAHLRSAEASNLSLEVTDAGCFQEVTPLEVSAEFSLNGVVEGSRPLSWNFIFANDAPPLADVFSGDALGVGALGTPVLQGVFVEVERPWDGRRLRFGDTFDDSARFEHDFFEDTFCPMRAGVDVEIVDTWAVSVVADE